MTITDKQREERKRGIGGTDVAKILGVSRWGGPWDVWASKMGIKTFDGNDATRRGNRFELPILQEYEEREQAPLVYSPPTLHHPQNDWMLANLDAQRVSDGVVVDAKNVGGRSAQYWGEEGTDAVPNDYLLQMAWYAAVADVDGAHIAALIGGTDFRVYRIKRDLELEHMIIDRVGEWWQRHIVNGEEPAPDGSSAFFEVLSQRYPVSRGHLLPATTETAAAAEQLRKAREMKAQAEKLEAEARALLCSTIGDADGVEGDGFKITWRSPKPTVATDWQALALELKPDPELIRKHTTEKPGSRRFLPKFD